MPKDSSPMPNSTKSDDIALRKKKNADAQAAFRARRNNYISTLEETVDNLESVVMQLQESCRDARSEAQELRQDNIRLRQALRDRENFWRAVWPRKGQGSEGDDCPPPFPSSNDQTGFSGPISSSQLPKFPDGMGYRDDPAMCNNQYPSNSTPHHSPSVALIGASSDISAAEGAAINSRMAGAKYTPYFSQPPAARDAAWPQSITQSSSSGGDSGVPAASSHSSNSPHFVESPTLTSSDMYLGRFHPEEQKVPMNNLDTAPYVFPTSRSISPSSSTPPSSSSTSLTSPFQFFPDTPAVQDRADFDYRRQNAYGAEVTLHGGTADVSMASSGAEGVRYRLGSNRRLDGGADRALLPLLPPLSGGSDNGSQHERGSSDGDSVPYPNSRLRPRRTAASSRSSPGVAPLSGTLAVIKAQAFGALRRTRVRSKKPGDGVAKVAMDVLEARGISMDVQVGAKRRRQSDDDEDIDDTPS